MIIKADGVEIKSEKLIITIITMIEYRGLKLNFIMIKIIRN